MESVDWTNKADILEVFHKGTPVLSHPDVISTQESQWKQEHIEEERGHQAYQAISDLFDEEIDEDE